LSEMAWFRQLLVSSNQIGNNSSRFGVNFDMRLSLLLVVLLALSGGSFGTKEKPHLPCEYSGAVSRKYPNTAFAMASGGAICDAQISRQIGLTWAAGCGFKPAPCS
jgi:hypothetical protein